MERKPGKLGVVVVLGAFVLACTDPVGIPGSERPAWDRGGLMGSGSREEPPPDTIVDPAGNVQPPPANCGPDGEGGMLGSGHRALAECRPVNGG